MTTIPVDMTSANSVFDWIFHSLDTNLFGSIALMFFGLLAIIFCLLMLFNANKWTALGFIGSFLLAVAFYGYTIVGWIAPLSALLMGLLLGIAFIKIFL